MSDYGVTKEGFIRKRQDVIKSEIQDSISTSMGVDVSQNPQSLLNVLLTDFSNRLARLWELAEDVYYSQYITTAEGVNLDYVAEASGLTRQDNTRTKYTIACTGKDGTALGYGTRIASTTNPKQYFTSRATSMITRDAFNSVKIKVLAVQSTTTYTVTLDGTAYTITSDASATATKILTDLMTEITDEAFTITLDSDILQISSQNAYTKHKLVLSDNLTTEEVTGLIVFQSEAYGKIVLPEGTITEIITATDGFTSCTNLGNPTYGTTRQTDSEYRHSYLAKIANRSTMILDSISASLLENVDGVVSATCYENATDETDSENRPPHSVEIVVQGGNDDDIASDILKTKPCGINTYGSVEIEVPDLFDSTIKVRFNRPTSLYTWFKVVITKNTRESLPTNYVEIVKNVIIDDTSGITAGEEILGQSFISDINTNCAGIAYVDIYVYANTDSTHVITDADFTEHNLFPTSRQLATIDASRIIVEVTS